MEKFEKIIELLEKKSLTESEKKLLEEFSTSDQELKSFIRIYRSLDSNYSSSGHLHTDLLASFVLYEMGDELESKLIPLLRYKIQSHLEGCSVCRDQYNLLVDEYKNVQYHINKSINTEPQPSFRSNKISRPFFIARSSSLKYAIATLSVLIVTYLGLFFISSSITPDYKKNIFSSEQEDFYKTRGRTSTLFQQGLNAIEQGDYLKAIEFLSEDIKEHQNEKSIFYSYYIIGITYLKSAESGFIGLFKSYNRENVNLAITNLKESINKNNSGEYESLKLDSYYYLGRAYLLNEDGAEARLSLQKVISGKGRYTKESAELISQMEKN